MTEKNSLALAPEPGLNAGHDARQMGFNDLVVRLPSVFLAGQEPAPLHQPQVFGGHVAGDFARLGQFPDRVAALEEHLHHPKAMWMSQRLEAFRRLRQGIQGRELGQFRGFRLGGHSCTSLYSNISECSDLSISISLSDQEGSADGAAARCHESGPATVKAQVPSQLSAGKRPANRNTCTTVP